MLVLIIAILMSSHHGSDRVMFGGEAGWASRCIAYSVPACENSKVKV